MKWRIVDSCGGNYYCWVLEDWVKTEFDFDELEINLFSEDSGDMSQFDLAFIEETVSKLDYYFDKAIDYIKSELRSNPDQFKLTEDELAHIKELAANNKYISIPDNKVERYANVPAYEFPVNQPNVMFYPGELWLIRFAEADFPAVNYGHGIALFFNKEGEITDFEILPEE